MIYHRFERFTYYKPPAMPEVVDNRDGANHQNKSGAEAPLMFLHN
jgi:hypothetical protein